MAWEGRRGEDAMPGGDPAPDDERDDDDGEHKIHSTRKVNLNKYRLLAYEALNHNCVLFCIGLAHWHPLSLSL